MDRVLDLKLDFRQSNLLEKLFESFIATHDLQTTDILAVRKWKGIQGPQLTRNMDLFTRYDRRAEV